MKLHFTINGRKQIVDAPPLRRLLDFVREDLKLTGSKEGCGEGECGACTVLLDGKPVNSCLVPCCQVDGAELVTVEGLASTDGLDPIQSCFIEHGGLQCGICTPGFLLSSKALLDSNSNPTDQEIREGLAGNLCRCTGYTKIVESVRQAAAKKGAE
jgi:aerobic carbon-monoxide dehydrogenase small subunit